MHSATRVLETENQLEKNMIRNNLKFIINQEYQEIDQEYIYFKGSTTPSSACYINLKVSKPFLLPF